MTVDRLRRISAWAALALGSYLISPYAVPAVFCVYWVTAKRDPDGAFALVAWAVWCLVGFAAVIGLITGLFGPIFGAGLASPLYAVMAALVLFEFFYVPLREGGMAEFRRHMELFQEAAEEKNWESAALHAGRAYQYAGRIRWAGKEPRAAAAYLMAQANLMQGRPEEAERMASEALPVFEKAGPIEGIPADLVFACRGVARLASGNSGGTADLQQAIRLRRSWAGDDATLRAMEESLRESPES